MLVPDGLHGVERRYLTAKTPVADILLSIGPKGEGVIVEGGRATIDTQRDYFKPSALHYSLEHIDRMRAWCVGDPDEITALLGRIHTCPHNPAQSNLAGFSYATQLLASLQRCSFSW